MLCWSIAHLTTISLLLGLALAAPPAAPKKREEKAKVSAMHAPDGFIEMFVAGVLSTEGGPAVVLKDAEEKRLLPIWIGFAEAHAIQLRLERRRFPRPLTHDLLEHIMTELGGELVKIHVDGLEGNTFVGTVFVKSGDKVTNFDARPSDSIALALGNKVPIYVSKRVLDRVENDRKEKLPKPDDEDEKPRKTEDIKTL